MNKVFLILFSILLISSVSANVFITNTGINVTDGQNVTANYVFNFLEWAGLKNVPNILYGIWANNNDNNLLISNGTSIGFNSSILNNTIGSYISSTNLSINFSLYSNNSNFLNGQPISYFAPNLSLSNYYLNSNPNNYGNSTNLVPYSGASSNVDLNGKNLINVSYLKANIINATNKVYSGNGFFGDYYYTLLGAFPMLQLTDTGGVLNGDWSVASFLINSVDYGYQTYLEFNSPNSASKSQIYANDSDLVINGNNRNIYINNATAFKSPNITINGSQVCTIANGFCGSGSTFNNTYNNLLNQNCPAGQVFNGTLSNGTFICTTVSSGSSGWLPNNSTENNNYTTTGNLTARTVLANNGVIALGNSYFGTFGSSPNITFASSDVRKNMFWSNQVLWLKENGTGKGGTSPIIFLSAQRNAVAHANNLTIFATRSLSGDTYSGISSSGNIIISANNGAGYVTINGIQNLQNGVPFSWGQDSGTEGYNYVKTVYETGGIGGIGKFNLTFNQPALDDHIGTFNVINTQSTAMDYIFSNKGYQPNLVLNASGNVGIGTFSPNYKLHVNGTFYSNNITSIVARIEDIFAGNATIDNEITVSTLSVSKNLTANNITVTDKIIRNSTSKIVCDGVEYTPLTNAAAFCSSCTIEVRCGFVIAIT